MKYARTIIAVLLVAILAFAVVGCAKAPAEEKAPEAAEDAKFKVGISLLYRQDEYYKDLDDETRKYFEKLWEEVIIN